MTSPVLWWKVTARGFRGRDSLRGLRLDCVLRTEASLRVREKADPASCMAARAALVSTVLLGADVVLEMGTSCPGRFGKFQVPRAGTLGEGMRMPLLLFWVVGKALE